MKKEECVSKSLGWILFKLYSGISTIPLKSDLDNHRNPLPLKADFSRNMDNSRFLQIFQPNKLYALILAIGRYLSSY